MSRKVPDEESAGTYDSLTSADELGTTQGESLTSIEDDSATSADDDDIIQRLDYDHARMTQDVSLPGYSVGRKIGVGGMGEIVLARDNKIGRDVAIKRLRTATPSANARVRFLREARIQAQLDHPAIIPVHEVGEDTSGAPYFTMKRVTGVTLATRLKKKRPSLHQLLRMFVDVCRAVDFAHARGVVHRDLKPGNVMLGNFGEVHVIDWGVARVVGEGESVAQPGEAVTFDGMTEAGLLLGTPGYMAPEQVHEPSSVGPEADIYSLGAMLFEILAEMPLHPRGAAALKSTLAGIDPSPSRRRPDRAIPPELAELTCAALAHEPLHRPTARVLADGIERYLDGDRDVEQRRTLAAAELATAHAALVTGDALRRPDAIRAAGRALALDPESRDAAAMITSFMLEPPRELPAALRDNLAASEAAIQQRQGRVAVRSLVAVLVFLGAAALNGLRSAPVLIGIAGWAALVLVVAYLVSRRPAKPNEMWLIAIGNTILGALLSRLFGPLVIAPVVSCIMAVSLTSYPQLMPHARIVIAMLVTAWLVPVGLEAVGVLAPTWHVLDGMVVSTSSVVQVSQLSTTILLVGGNVMAIIVIGMFANALARSRREAQRTVEIQAWHLRQLLPTS